MFGWVEILSGPLAFPTWTCLKTFYTKSKEKNSKLSSMTGNAGTRESHSTVAAMLFRVLPFTEHSLDLSFNLKIDMRPAQAVLYSDLNLESVCFSSSCFACSMSCYITYHAAARMLDGYHPVESIAMMLFY